MPVIVFVAISFVAAGGLIAQRAVRPLPDPTYVLATLRFAVLAHEPGTVSDRCRRNTLCPPSFTKCTAAIVRVSPGSCAAPVDTHVAVSGRSVLIALAAVFLDISECTR